MVFGFVSMAVVVMLGTFALVAAFVPGGVRAMRASQKDPSQMPAPSAAYYASNIVLSFIAAIVGTWVTAQTAAPAPKNQLIALGVLILVMGVASSFSPGNERQPSWYRRTIPLVGVAGVAVGAVVLHAV